MKVDQIECGHTIPFLVEDFTVYNQCFTSHCKAFRGT